MAEEVNKTIDTLRILMRKGMKTYYVYNVNGLMDESYETQHDAVAGTPTIRTQYKYYVDSPNVKGILETVVPWDTAWDFENL